MAGDGGIPSDIDGPHVARTRQARGRGARVVVAALAFIASCAAFAVLQPRRARAQVLVALDYQAAPALLNCPSAADFRQEIAAQIGRDPFRQVAPRRVVVRLYMVGIRMAGRVEWRDAADQWEGERAFSSRNESCAQMARSMALATAIQIQLLESLERGTAPKPVEPPPPPPPPPPVAPPVIVERPTAPPRSEVRIDVTLGGGVIQDFSDSPAFVVPRLAIAVARPSAYALRFAASGFGPGAEVSRAEGSAQLDRLLMTLAVMRSFRSDKRIQPMISVGAGWQNVRVKGTSAMPSVAAGHEGHTNAAVLTAGAGVALAVAGRLSLFVEAEALLYSPSLTVKLSSYQSARIGGAALFAHGGLLAHF